MEREPLITDFIPLIGTDKKVQVIINFEWLDALVVGIDIPENRIKLDVLDHDTKFYLWKDLFFQLNKNFPKQFKVRI